MKAKTLLLTLCSIFIMWSCELDSSLSVLGGNDELFETVHETLAANSANYNGSSTNTIPYYVAFSNITGEFTLYYLPSAINDIGNGGISNGSGNGGSSGGGSGGNQGGHLIGNIPPAVNTFRPVPSNITLNYKVDIYITNDNKILYPPVYLPYCRMLPNSYSKIEENLLFERNQYPDVFLDLGEYAFITFIKPEYEIADKIICKESDLTGQMEPVNIKDTVIYTIKDGYIYFHVYPNSYIFEEGVNDVDLGRIHIGYYETSIDQPIHSVIYDISYDVYINLKLIKGNPPIIDPDDYRKLPVDKLYNIQVNEFKETIFAYSLTDKNKIVINAPDLGLKAYKNHGFFKNKDNTISIVNSDGKQIIKYPDNYSVKVVPDLAPLPMP